jgi:hypothetical protein
VKCSCGGFYVPQIDRFKVKKPWICTLCKQEAAKSDSIEKDEQIVSQTLSQSLWNAVEQGLDLDSSFVTEKDLKKQLEP